MSGSDAVQLEVRIEDWLSSLGEEIQNRLGIAGGMHTASSCFSAAAAAAAAADLDARCAAGEGNRIAMHEMSGVHLRSEHPVHGFACMKSLQDLHVHQTCQLPSFRRLL